MLALLLDLKQLEGGDARQILLNWLVISGVIPSQASKKSAFLLSYSLENRHVMCTILK